MNHICTQIPRMLLAQIHLVCIVADVNSVDCAYIAFFILIDSSYLKTAGGEISCVAASFLCVFALQLIRSKSRDFSHLKK